MKSLKIKAKVVFLLLSILVLLINACKEPDFLGLDVLPENDKFSVVFKEDLDVVAYTVKEDSIRSDKTLLSLLGSYNDPVFGHVSSSFYTHIRISSNNVDFGPNPVVDSLVLSLVHKGHYGIPKKVNIRVFEVMDDFYKDSIYYSNISLPIDNIPLASKTVLPNPSDSVMVGGQKQAPQLRIKLDNALAQRFFDASGSAHLADNDAFMSFFKGLYITSLPVYNNGAIYYFDVLNPLSQLTLYYKNDNNDSLKFNFVINDFGSRINKFEHYEFINADPILQQQIGGDTLLGDSVLYLQAMAGTKIKINFPNLKQLMTDNIIAFNKAELIIPVEEMDLMQNIYKYPAKLNLVRITESGELAFIIDQFEGESHFRGMFDETKKEYSFTITRHLQNILLNNIEDYGLYLMTSGAAISGDRVVLRGPAHSLTKMKLRITYIK